MPNSQRNEKPRSRSSRQQPGLACEQCRKRKLRCDRKQPSCSGCLESGVICFTNVDRLPRGPKKGSHKELQERLRVLEERLANSQDHQRDSSSTRLESLQDSAEEQTDVFDAAPEPVLPITPTSDFGDELLGTPPYNLLQSTFPSPPELTPCHSEIIKADLDELFFDRVYQFIPIINQRRYYNSSSHEHKTKPFNCLQHALWTLATCFSTRSEQVGSRLYNRTRSLLEDLEHTTQMDNMGMDSPCFEQTQAWILITIYEFMRTDFQQAWQSAGRSFRYVQLLKLHEVDAGLSTDLDWMELEVRRRTFWVAYCLDRLISVHSGLPLAFTELMILTRLPSSELDFYTENPVLNGYLSEAVSTGSQVPMSRFGECIAFITLFGHVQSHRQQCDEERIYGKTDEEFWRRHMFLDVVLTRHIQASCEKHPSKPDRADPSRVFTVMMAHAAMLALCRILESVTFDTNEYTSVILGYQQRSLASAQEILAQVNALGESIYFKTHPFTPVPLKLCAEFFAARAATNASLNSQLEEVMGALRSLRAVNGMANDCLRSLGREEVENV